MKKYLAFLLTVIILSFSVFPVYAYDWPPENYDMPRTVLTIDTVKNSLAGLVNSIRSIADTGLIILVVLLPLFLILPLFDKLVIRNLKSKSVLGKTTSFGITVLEQNNLLRKDFQSVQVGSDLDERLFLNESSYSVQGFQPKSPSGSGTENRRRR